MWEHLLYCHLDFKSRLYEEGKIDHLWALLNLFLVLCFATMTTEAEFSARFYSYNKMYSFESRQHSFADWPFREECQCTPEMVRSIVSCFAFLGTIGSRLTKGVLLKLFSNFFALRAFV